MTAYALTSRTMANTDHEPPSKKRRLSRKGKVKKGNSERFQLTTDEEMELGIIPNNTSKNNLCAHK